ncbi:cupin domain-containing protein [Shewanella sp. D64]|uniref:cupin domain-containing protein n=1 Tax=unclassified Shewanella TaxID=196818 RepID=UPI0022BA70C3|nr:MULTISPECIES: cupin domain-containing protein [unclassified Shewanella]MEC4725087.1 cupin domain-containing protein [Shewanella sp. D64]MEC4736988.1 cupin domain-containing protein [Shewanella sp. E94]WBJ98099.1 cupin domain-containing protein [Shewanella sp. MTB7]
MQSAEGYIQHLELEQHVEGGYYRSSYRSDEPFDDKRALWSSIYFLLRTDEVSNFHRLTADEMWYFHAGQSLTIYMIDEEGKLTTAQLGLDLAAGERPQFLVPKGSVFGSAMNQPGFSLVGCMVSPGFTFEDFELFSQESLLEEYPEHKEVIQRLSRKSEAAS